MKQLPGTSLFFVVCLLAGAALAAAAVTSFAPRAVPAEAAAGSDIWRAQGCEGCHTLYGAGGAYAPDLTGIYAQRGESYLREFLANPAALHPGQRVMPSPGLTVAETTNLLVFLEWVGEQETGWPPRPILVAGGGSLDTGVEAASAPPSDELPDDPVARGAYWFKRPPAICATCHALEPDIVIVGPSLAGVASRAAARVPGEDAQTYLRNAIIHPEAYIVPGFQDVMQKNLGEKLSAEQINDIIAFLMTLN